MVKETDTTPTLSDKTAHENEAATVNKCIIRKIWKRSVRAEQQLDLMRRLAKLKLGTKNIEEKFVGIANCMKQAKNKVRDVEEIVNIMNKKVEDAEITCEKANKKKSKSRRKLEEKFGTKSKKTKNLLKQLNKEMIALRKEIKNKNKEKVDNLVLKYLKPVTVHEIDKKLKRYEDITVLKGVKTDPKASVDILIIGDEIELDSDEIEALKLPPKTAKLDKLSEENFRTEVEASLAKYRWAKKEEIDSEDVNDGEEITEEEKEMYEQVDAESRQIYNPASKSMDYRKKRATDLKENTKVYLPRPLPTQQEAFAAVRREKWLETHKKYMKENCNEEGNQKTNLTPAQERGLRKLRKRIKDGNLMVILTDKSGKLAVTTVENYIKMGEVHVKKDTEVDDDKAKEIQRKTNGHVSMWIKMTNMGENWNHTARIRETCINHSCCVCPMYLLVKDHKLVKPGELPPTRPVCSGCSSMGVHLSNILSDIIDAIANSMKNKIEVVSTEDLLNKIDEYNKKVDKTKDSNMDLEGLAMTGADATALYPNLEGRQGGRIVRDAYLQSDLVVEGVNYKETARYVAMGYDPYEVRSMGLERIVPKRRFRKGTKPGVTGKETLSKETEDEIMWCFPVREPTDLEKKRLLALEIGVRKAFSLHLYQFGGKYYHQKDGGPIGTRLAGSVARVVMGVWGERMLKIMKKNDIKVHLAAVYVDDVRFLTSVIKKGMRWVVKKKTFETREIWQEEDENDEKEGLSEEARTARELLKAMNSIFTNIQFTSEIPEDFPDKRLPTLDFSCWIETDDDMKRNSSKVEEQEGENSAEPARRKVLYSFFEKTMNSPFCILERSALPENTKISSLSQEVVRRMLNTSEMVRQEERNAILETFITKLRVSGYRQEQTKRIVEAGLKGYEGKLEKARKSGEDIHRSSKSTENLRYSKKLLEKSNWFKKKGKSQESEVGKSNNPGKKKTAGNWEKQPTKNSVPITVLFVPKTPGGEFAKRLKEAESEIEKITGDRIKIVERAGVTVRRLLHKSNPWAGEQCGRQECLVCRQEKNGDCTQRNVTYQTECLLCQEKTGKKSRYVGETSRTGFERGLEHQEDYRTNKEDSHMFKHWLEEHLDEEKPEFSMKIIRKHTSSFIRQIHEAVVIEMNTENKTNVLNSKGEYNRCQLPRLGVKMGLKCVEEEREDKNLSEYDIFLAIKPEKKRRNGEGGEKKISEPANKRRRLKARKPEVLQSVKRIRDQEQEGEPGIKKARIDRKEEECEDSQDSQKTAMIRRESVNNKTCQNVPNLNFKINQNPRKSNVKKIINFFENTVCDAREINGSKANSSPGPPANNSKLILSDIKATPSRAPTTTTTPRPGIKKLQGKKLVPPEFKFKKISAYFASKSPNEDKKSDLTPIRSNYNLESSTPNST